MKKIIKTTMLMLLIASLAIGLIACVDDAPVTTEDIKASIYIGEAKYDVEIPKGIKTNLFIELKVLCARQGITLVSETGAFGEYITAVGDMKAGANSFIALYTSVLKDKDVSEYCETITLGDKTVYTSGFGISSMSIENGAVYLIKLGTF